ncbi:MAG: hypothetical protein JNJ45_06420 [Chthonomonas sp.]|nr:hypothetical protein [Chthonomonas sp.]
MRKTLLACLLVGATFSTPLLLRSQTMQETPKSAPRRANPFANLGQLTVRAQHEVEGKASAFAPTLEQLETFGVKKLEGVKLEGNLPGELVISSNSFKSKVNGDTIFSIELRVVRPVSMLGTVEVVEATVWSNSTVGRSTDSSAATDMMESVGDMLTNLRKDLEG